MSTRPDAVRSMSVDTATQRSTALQGDTPRDKKETARIAENFQLAGRFPRVWQVLGSNQRRLSRRFYSPSLLVELDAADQGIRRPRRRAGPPPSAMCPCARGQGAGDARTGTDGVRTLADGPVSPTRRTVALAEFKRP